MSVVKLSNRIMEPMCLSNSPKSPSSPGTNPNFLPAFLMGSSQPTSPNTKNSSPSALQANRSINYKGTPNIEPKNLRQKLFQQTVNESHYTTYDNVAIEKGGPPKLGLFDTLNANKATSPIMSSTMHNQYEQPSFNFNDSYARESNESMNQSAYNYNNSIALSQLQQQQQQYNQFNNMQQEKSNFLWVTVFGFPPSAAGLVLAQFSNFGSIIEKQFPSQGNWVNIKYSSTFEATKALSMHGKLISNCIMVGVMPCNNNGNNKQDNNKENLDGNSFVSPNRTRMLRQTFSSPQMSSNEVVQPQGVPQKSTGLVSKAMEYIFGW